VSCSGCSRSPPRSGTTTTPDSASDARYSPTTTDQAWNRSSSRELPAAELAAPPRTASPAAAGSVILCLVPWQATRRRVGCQCATRKIVAGRGRRMRLRRPCLARLPQPPVVRHAVRADPALGEGARVGPSGTGCGAAGSVILCLVPWQATRRRVGCQCATRKIVAGRGRRMRLRSRVWLSFPSLRSSDTPCGLTQPWGRWSPGKGPGEAVPRGRGPGKVVPGEAVLWGRCADQPDHPTGPVSAPRSGSHREARPGRSRDAPVPRRRPAGRRSSARPPAAAARRRRRCCADAAAPSRGCGGCRR